MLDHVAVARRLPQQSSGRRQLIPHQTPLAGRDLKRRPSGLWLTTPLRTLVQCSSLLTHEALVCALDFALRTNLVEAAELSPAETLVRLLLLPALPGLGPQVPLHDRTGRVVARFDLGDRHVQRAVENDGKRGHAGTQLVAKDRRRDRTTERLGWTTERVTCFGAAPRAGLPRTPPAGGALPPRSLIVGMITADTRGGLDVIMLMITRGQARTRGPGHG